MKRSRKTFLSTRPDETGSICTKVDSSSGMRCYFIEAELKIYDCSRSVILDFDCFDASDLKERIEKANLLLDEIARFRDDLIACKAKTKFFY